MLPITALLNRRRRVPHRKSARHSGMIPPRTSHGRHEGENLHEALGSSAGEVIASAIMVPSVRVLAGVLPDGFLSATGSFAADGESGKPQLQLPRSNAAGHRRPSAPGRGAAGLTPPAIRFLLAASTRSSRSSTRPTAASRSTTTSVPVERDSLLSNTGTGLTHMNPLGPGDFRLNLTNSFLVLGDGHWAVDAAWRRSTSSSLHGPHRDRLDVGDAQVRPLGPGAPARSRRTSQK